MLVAQRSQMEVRMKEAERALSELEKLDEDAVVYKNVGTILIKSQKDKVKEELVDKKDTLEMRLKTIQRQEERTRTQFEEARTKIQAALQRQGPGTDLGNLGPM